MKQARLTPCFKGERDYIHGTDVFDGLNLLIAEEFGFAGAQDLRFAVHRVIRSDLDVVLHSHGEAEAGPEACATLTFSHQGSRWKLSAAETGAKVDCRYPYDESGIASACQFDAVAKSAVIRAPLKVTDIELWVSANKVLLQHLFPETQGKWWFVKAEIDGYTRSHAYREVELTLVHNFNLRLTKTSVLVDGVKRGFIYFSMR